MILTRDRENCQPAPRRKRIIGCLIYFWLRFAPDANTPLTTARFEFDV